MKKTLLSVFVVGSVLVACGQNPTPPENVQTAFTKKFNTVQKVKWTQEDNEWEAEFELNKTEMSASYDNSGNWLETETEIDKKDVPAEILKAVTQKFGDWEIDELEKIEKPDFKGYEIALEKDETETETEILVSETGEITVKNVSDEEKN